MHLVTTGRLHARPKSLALLPDHWFVGFPMTTRLQQRRSRQTPKRGGVGLEAILGASAHILHRLLQLRFSAYLLDRISMDDHDCANRNNAQSQPEHAKGRSNSMPRPQKPEEA